MQAFDALSLVLRWLLAVVVQSLQVAASTEQGSLAGNDHAFNFRACLGHAQCLDACRIHFWAESILVFGIAQGKNKGGTFAGAEQLS